jgi:hypothetical protein
LEAIATAGKEAMGVEKLETSFRRSIDAERIDSI